MTVGRIASRALAALALAAALGLGAGPALADPTGTWTTEGGLSRVEIAPCGGSYCGTVVWTKDPDRRDAKSGEPIRGMRILTDLVETGPDTYRGALYNPQDGRNYTGYMTVNGNTAQLKGCVVRPLCKSQTWTK